ncbi:MAG TPA: hemolysin III family protein [Gemmatimonadaceae bacterium]|nr:hemolysin III family protein [Gemmatimonadaceae bacterium]
MRSLREPVSALTHSLGALLSVLGLIILLAEAIGNDSVRQVVAFSIFGGSLVAMYSVSAFYHSFNFSERGIAQLRRIDHMMIYVLIAGTYTPVCLLLLPEPLGLVLLSTVWALATIGTAMKIVWMDSPIWISTALYLGLGWIAVVLIKPLLAVAPTGFFLWILAGGLFYSIGAVVHALKWPRPSTSERPLALGSHEIWHLFVMAGSFSHYWAILTYASEVR